MDNVRTDFYVNELDPIEKAVVQLRDRIIAGGKPLKS